MSYRAGFVGLVGMPNAGKSTLVNILVGEKVAIVTPKPQTTRKRMLGIVAKDDYQAIFVDAPGVTRSTSGLNDFLQTEWRSVIEDSDFLLAILNLDEKGPEPLVGILELVRRSGKPWAAVITKYDLGTDDRVGFLKAELLKDNVPIVITSSKENPEAAAKDVLELIAQSLPEADGPLFDPELITTSNLRDMTAEIIREKCFLELGEEIPYGLGIKIQAFNERQGRPTEIIADIIVDKESHKPMVIGSGGRKIKAIGTAARGDIERLIGSRVYLELHVVVKEKWTRSPNVLKDLGYVKHE